MNRPLNSTGFPPHFGIACIKSTPGRQTNHAIMLLVCVNGTRRAVPLGAPKVYSIDGGDISGGDAKLLASQVTDTLLEFTLSNERLLDRLMGNVLFNVFFLV